VCKLAPDRVNVPVPTLVRRPLPLLNTPLKVVLMFLLPTVRLLRPETVPVPLKAPKVNAWPVDCSLLPLLATIRYVPSPRLTSAKGRLRDVVLFMRTSRPVKLILPVKADQSPFRSLRT